jgi:hypothetical protein
MRMVIVIAVLLVAGFFGAKVYVEHRAADGIDAAVRQLRPFVDLRYGDVTASITGELKVERINGKVEGFDDSFSVDTITLVTPGFRFLLGMDRRMRDFDVPDSFGIELAGLRMPVGADFLEALDTRRKELGSGELTPAEACIGAYGFTPDELRALGYEELASDLRVAYRRKDNRLVVAVASHNEDMYDVDLALTFDGISDPTELARGAAPVLIEGRVDYVDRSLNGRIMKSCTEKHGVPAEEVLAAQQAEIQTLARTYRMELDPAILDPYTQFLQGKQRFTLISKPLEPVDLRHVKLYKPSDVPNLLNLMAEAN